MDKESNHYSCNRFVFASPRKSRQLLCCAFLATVHFNLSQCKIWTGFSENFLQFVLGACTAPIGRWADLLKVSTTKRWSTFFFLTDIARVFVRGKFFQANLIFYGEKPAANVQSSVLREAFLSNISLTWRISPSW